MLLDFQTFQVSNLEGRADHCGYNLLLDLILFVCDRVLRIKRIFLLITHGSAMLLGDNSFLSYILRILILLEEWLVSLSVETIEGKLICSLLRHRI